MVVPFLLYHILQSYLNPAVIPSCRTGQQEKCVDISLAVEMLYMATVPDAYDVAVIITGDKDFMPAMQKTRLTGTISSFLIFLSFFDFF